MIRVVKEPRTLERPKILGYATTLKEYKLLGISKALREPRTPRRLYTPGAPWTQNLSRTQDSMSTKNSRRIKDM